MSDDYTWPPKSGEDFSYPLVIEHYGQDFGNLDDEESEMEIYIPIS